MSAKEFLPPIGHKLETALRSIGYSFESAVADIIDNSIDARASGVLVRLLSKKDGSFDLVVWDDGSGMDEGTLREAMRFGADVSKDLGRLGKFGLGLKLASLSQALEVRVITSSKGHLSGRAWPEHGIAEGFACLVFNEDECRQQLLEAVPDHPFKGSGTIVRWSHLFRLRRQQGDPNENAQRLLRRLENFLALAFHRYLGGKPRRVAIILDNYNQESARSGIPIPLDPLNPFDYRGQSGNPEFPAKMLLEGKYRDRISVTAHIWPPNSTAPEYRLPGGANSRQGFYFYRNNRLIQGGGWNGLRETEPHSSLARLEIDMGADFDLEVSLDVKKTEIQLPPGLADAIQKSRTGSGIDFKKYLSLADAAYRKRKATDAELPLIPSKGLPSPLAAFLRKELRIRKTPKHHRIRIMWKKLGENRFFETDRDEGRLYINQAYRRQLHHGVAGSSADLPVLKCLLFLVLEDALSSERTGSKMRERLDQINRILVKAVKYERSPE